MSRTFHICPICDNDLFDDIPCSKCGYDPETEEHGKGVKPMIIQINKAGEVSPDEALEIVRNSGEKISDNFVKWVEGPGRRQYKAAQQQANKEQATKKVVKKATKKVAKKKVKKEE